MLCKKGTLPHKLALCITWDTFITQYNTCNQGCLLTFLTTKILTETEKIDVVLFDLAYNISGLNFMMYLETTFYHTNLVHFIKYKI